MKSMKFNITRIVLVLLALFSVQSSFAQQPVVTVNLNILQPYSPFYRDYAGFSRDYAGLNMNNTIVTLISNMQAQVYLTASITSEDNSISIRVKDNYRPNMPVNLTANIPQTLTGLQLKNIYGSGDVNELMLTGLSAREIIYNQTLPEGSYTICMQARDYATGIILGENCQTIYVTYYEPPQIISPYDLSALTALYPQSILTSWTPVTPNLANIRYRLRIVKLVPGVSALDALKNSTQVILDRSNITTPNFILDVASGVLLDTGNSYAMQVTASASNAYFKNNGESEPVTFLYKGNPYLIPGSGGITLNFINPSAKQAYVEVNNETPMLINWNWFDLNTVTDTLFLNDTAYKNYGVVKYIVKIANTTKGIHRGEAAGSIIYSEEINLINDSLRSYLILSKKSADSVGFKDLGWYKASVEAYGAQDNLIKTANSVMFQYRIIPDAEPALNIPVNAVLNYVFNDSVGTSYFVSNTSFEVNVLKKANGPSATVPISVINGVSYFNLSKTAGTTDATGAFHTTVTVPFKFLTGDSLYFKVSLPGEYYIDKDFPLVSIPAVNKDTAINFGKLTAQTYAYSLKLYVKKLYTSYKISDQNGKMEVSLADSVFDADEYPYDYSSENGGTMTYAVESIKPAVGITVVMYRKNKQSYIPPIEGTLTDYTHTTGYVEVARGVTQIEKTAAGDVTYVKFDHLLSWIFKGDEYFILALNGENDPGQSPGGGTLQPGFNPDLNITLPGSQVPNNVQQNALNLNLQQTNTVQQPDLSQFQSPGQQQNMGQQFEWSYSFNPYINTVFSEEGFKAQPMEFKLVLPLDLNNKDSLYRHVEASYSIVSTKPPTSLVTGKLMYHWKSDTKDQLRPLTNAPFKIVVDYLVDGKPIGSIHSMSGHGQSYTMSQKFFVPEGQTEYSEGIELLDHNATMAVGKTDAQGNFVVDVVNFNQKGSLGKGYVVEESTTIDLGEETTIPVEFGFDDIIDPGMDDFGFPGDFGLNLGIDQNNGIQNMINGDAGIGFNGASGAFEVGFVNPSLGGQEMFQPGMHGPARAENAFAPQSTRTSDDKLVEFCRVYRVVPDNPYVYPCKDTFSVQAFEALNIPEPQKGYVKEIKLRVYSKDSANNKLNQMLVTVFRDINDKTSDLPLGEGNGEYKLTELISPQYTTTGEPIDIKLAKNLNPGGDIFSKKFELLWDPKPNANDGWVEFTTLLAGFSHYYVESCSDPSGQSSYKATFGSVNTEIDDYNPDYWYGIATPPAVEMALTLYPLPSRALVRLIDNVTKNSITMEMGGRVSIYKGAKIFSDYVDEYGYLEFKANEYPLNFFLSPVNFIGSAPGYKKAPGMTSAQFTFAPFGQQYICNYLLDPALMMQGHIVNMDKTPKEGVPSYIKVVGGKVIETLNDGSFANLPVPGVEGIEILIIPKDVGFFDSTYRVTHNDVVNAAINIHDFGVYRRKHRIRFTVTDESNNPLAYATVQLGDTVKKTNFFGKAFYNFENVSVNNFTFVIRGPAGQNYIPKTLNKKNFESRDYENVIVKLKTGSEVHGKVTLDGQPVKNAKVYIDVATENSFIPFLWNNDALSQDANLVVAHSDASGNYILRGVPVNNQSIYLHATLDTSYTVNGDLRQVNIQNHTATLNFALTSFKGMLVNNLFGFPLSVEKIVVVTPDSSQIKVTGVVHWSKAISNFYLDEGNQVLRVEDVPYTATMVNGKKVGVPQQASIPINGITNLKFKYLNKYNVKLTAIAQSGSGIWNPTPLSITKENDLGVMKGKVSIVDNSFNYPSTYLDFSSAKDNFYLAEKVNEKTVNTSISAVTSAMTETQVNHNYYQNNQQYLSDIQSNIYQHQSQPKTLYNLSNANGDSIKFKLIEFNASADPTKSFIDAEGKIHLNVNLNCYIPNAQPANFHLNIEEMILDNNEVLPASGSKPIILSLEKWNLKITNWNFSTEEGGIVSNTGLVNTSAVDIPFTTFVLRHDLFLMDDFQLQSLKMAGGNISLNNINVANAAIVFDNKTGNDMKPHWRFSISGNPAAQLEQLDDINGIIKLNYIQILSNNESVFQLQQQSTPLKIRTNPLAQFSPESIFNGPDYISIAGALNVGAPRMGPIPLRLDYKNPHSMSPQNVVADFEAQGFVHFTSRNPGNNIPNITITPDIITILGNVHEMPVPTFNEVPSTFTATVGGAPFYTNPNPDPVYKVEMQKNFVTQLDNIGNAPNPKGHQLKIDNGGMAVIGSDWSILTYEGVMTSNSGADSIKPLTVKYAVLGDISADAGGMEVSAIETPFGAMKMVFDFKNKRMIGSITCNNIPLGTSKLSGTVETLFDPDGFYVAGGCSAEIQLPNIYVDGTYNMGFMVGSYPIGEGLWSVVNSYKNPAVKNECYRTNHPKLSGFYFTIDRIIVDKSIDFDFILASGYVNATALLGADIYANFSEPVTVGVEAHAFGEVKAGLASITGTSISGGLSLLALMKFAYEAPDFVAQGSIDMKFNATISQSLVMTTISKSFDINCHTSGGTEGFSFSLGSGDPKQDCSK